MVVGLLINSPTDSPLVPLVVTATFTVTTSPSPLVIMIMPPSTTVLGMVMSFVDY